MELMEIIFSAGLGFIALISIITMIILIRHVVKEGRKKDNFVAPVQNPAPVVATPAPVAKEVAAADDTVIFSSEKALTIDDKYLELATEHKSRYDEIVELIDRDEFTKDPIGAYRDRIYSKNAPMKTAVIWNKNYVEER